MERIVSWVKKEREGVVIHATTEGFELEEYSIKAPLKTIKGGLEDIVDRLTYGWCENLNQVKLLHAMLQECSFAEDVMLIRNAVFVEEARITVALEHLYEKSRKADENVDLVRKDKINKWIEGVKLIEQSLNKLKEKTQPPIILKKKL